MRRTWSARRNLSQSARRWHWSGTLLLLGCQCATVTWTQTSHWQSPNLIQTTLSQTRSQILKQRQSLHSWQLTGTGTGGIVTQTERPRLKNCLRCQTQTWKTRPTPKLSGCDLRCAKPLSQQWSWSETWRLRASRRPVASWHRKPEKHQSVSWTQRKRRRCASGRRRHGQSGVQSATVRLNQSPSQSLTQSPSLILSPSQSARRLGCTRVPCSCPCCLHCLRCQNWAACPCGACLRLRCWHNSARLPSHCASSGCPHTTSVHRIQSRIQRTRKNRRQSVGPFFWRGCWWCFAKEDTTGKPFVCAVGCVSCLCVLG